MNSLRLISSQSTAIADDVAASPLVAPLLKFVCKQPGPAGVAACSRLLTSLVLSPESAAELHKGGLLRSVLSVSHAGVLHWNWCVVVFVLYARVQWVSVLCAPFRAWLVRRTSWSLRVSSTTQTQVPTCCRCSGSCLPRGLGCVLGVSTTEKWREERSLCSRPRVVVNSVSLTICGGVGCTPTTCGGAPSFPYGTLPFSAIAKSAPGLMPELAESGLQAAVQTSLSLHGSNAEVRSKMG